MIFKSNTSHNVAIHSRRHITADQRFDTEKTNFGRGLTKITEEYAEFNNKQIEGFIIKWDYGIMNVDIQLST